MMGEGREGDRVHRWFLMFGGISMVSGKGGRCEDVYIARYLFIDERRQKASIYIFINIL